MFVSAVSAKGPTNEQIGDLLPVGDLTPAQFRVEFDEPLKLKNADIELVSCKISKKNEIVIDSNNNSIAVRMGSFYADYLTGDLTPTGEQYVAKIAPRIYNSRQDLADEIARQINNVMPTNAYKGWSASVVVDKIQLTYTKQTSPGFVDFQTQNKEGAITTEGIKWDKVVDNDFMTYDCEDKMVTKTANKFGAPPNLRDEYVTCRGIDFGTARPAEVLRSSVNEYGMWEGLTKTGLTAVLRPTKSVIQSSFDTGFGGWGGASGKPQYLTFEFKDHKMLDGSPVDAQYKNGSMFLPQTQKDSIPREYENLVHRQINGCLNQTRYVADPRGTPYNTSHNVKFPYSIQGAKAVSPGIFNGKSRLASYKSNWTGQLSFNSRPGRPGGGLPSIPDGYTFQLDTGGLKGEKNRAHSIVQMEGQEEDRLVIRTTQAPLIRGLPQQQVANGPIVDTTITTGDILKPSSIFPLPPPIIEYIVGSVGRFNNREYGKDFLAPSIQNRSVLPSGEVVIKAPYYKILEVDAAGLPSSICLVDSGEGSVVYDFTKPKLTSLYLNDPATWRFLVPGDATDEAIVMDQQIYRVEPLAADIGEDGGLVEVKDALRYGSFNMGVVRDNLYQDLILENNAEVPITEDDPTILDVIKDLEVSFMSILERDVNGEPEPLDNPDQARFICQQFQPTLTSDGAYDRFAIRDMRRTIFNARSGTWSNLQGDGQAMANWAAFPGVSDANGGIKIEIKNRDTFHFQVVVSNTAAYGGLAPGATVWGEQVVLCETGTKRGGAGSPFRMEQTMKTRFYPLHPCYSQMPSTDYEKNLVSYSCDGSIYEPRSNAYDFVGNGTLVNNYRANMAFQADAPAKTNGRQNQFVLTTSNPASVPPGEDCIIMLKSLNLDKSQISAAPAVPSSGSVLIGDFNPTTTGTLGFNTGLHSVMYSKIIAPALSTNFALNSATTNQPFISSFVVEIPSLPIKGYISKMFGDGDFKNRRGMGSALPIVGVVPAQEFPATNELIMNYHYKTPYPQPIQVRLASTQFLYSMDFRLRNTLDGQILRDLIHSTEITIRIHHLPDETGKTIREQEISQLVSVV